MNKKKQKGFKLGTKLLLVFILLITTPLVTLGAFSYIKSTTIIMDNFKYSTAQILSDTDVIIDSYLESFEKALINMTNQSSVEMMLEDVDATSAATPVTDTVSNQEDNLVNNTESTEVVLEETDSIVEDNEVNQMANPSDTDTMDSVDWLMKSFESLMKSNEDVVHVYLATPSKDLYIYPDVNLDNGFDPTQRDWYKDAVASGSLTWTKPYKSEGTVINVTSVSIPIYDSNQKVLGVLGMDISLEGISERVNSIKFGKRGYPVIIGNDGKVFLHKNEDLVDTVLEVEEIISGVNSKDEGDVNYEFEEEGKAYDKFAVFRRIEKLDLAILAAMYMDEIVEDTRGVLVDTLLIGGISLLLAILVSLIFSRHISSNMKEVLAGMDKIKDGDFRVRVKVNSKDEIGMISKSFNNTIDTIGSLINNLKEISNNTAIASDTLADMTNETSASAEEVTRTVEEIARGANEQAQDAEQGAMLAHNLDNKFKELVEDSLEMDSSAKLVLEANFKGVDLVQDLMEKTRLNTDATSKIEKEIGELDTKTQDIGKILETISSISEETNLLALNASIEAARAGEQGRGFAVVASSIRELANGSRNATEEIKKIIIDIQTESTEAVEAMKEVKLRSSEQSQVVEEVDKSFSNISEAIKSISNKISTINSFVKNINQDKDLIVQAIENISSVSEETAASSQEVTALMEQQAMAVEGVAKEADNLKELSLNLNNEINKFIVE